MRQNVKNRLRNLLGRSFCSKRERKFLCAGILTVAVCMFLSGCQVAGTEIVLKDNLGEHEVFSINGTKVSDSKMKVYLANFQNIYGICYGIDLWQQDFQTAELTTYIKEASLAQITKIICMDQMAEANEITLDENDLSIIKTTAAEYYESLSHAEREYMNISQHEIEDLYEEYYLADKLYTSLTENVNREVSDDEARVMEAIMIYVDNEEAANNAVTRLNAGEDFAAVAAGTSQQLETHVYVSRADVPPEVEEVIFQLDNEAVSGIIFADGGYYIVKCISKYDQERTDANKANIVEQREKAAFDDKYDAFVLSAESELNDVLWESMTLITDGSIETDDFFARMDSAIAIE
ncbi:MAG: peptidylprolyl isomerase [Lachnospiraceae bacterium]